ncbi:uncharacterized protein A4U43_C01F8210 [Asparagus officinalis]|uniref:Uncharacterized protein n=1 Tax=Asparagus officinalis TaxID=4686 RepID=A0A5P1FN11_ASPOF|nr:uncharacterized protein A4U43_C01F8210 [Asparagus officinalis]
MLAGSQRQQRGQQEFGRGERERMRETESSGNNILSGFDTETLSNVMGINRQLAEKLKGRNDERGEIVRVQGRLEVLRPSRSESMGRGGGGEEYEYEEERGRVVNGLEQAFCSMRIKENIGNPRRADVYNPNAQRIPRSAVESKRPQHNVRHPWELQMPGGEQPRSDCLQQRGTPRPNPRRPPKLRSVETIHKRRVTIETNNNSISSPIVGKTSALGGMPGEVLMNSYRISREQARMVKMNRGEEFAVFSPRPAQQERERDSA